MNSILTDSIRRDREYAQLFSAINRTYDALTPLPIVAGGLCEGAADALCVSLLEDIGQTRGGCALVMCSDEKEAIRTKRIFESFGLRCGFFMARDLTFYNISASHEYEHERLSVLYGILDGEFDAVITTPDAALGYTIPAKYLTELSVVFDIKKTICLDETVKRLLAAGYIRTEMVESAGQFAVRGGIIDVFPPFGRYYDMDGENRSGAFPIRLELFGDEIDRMGLFEIETQRIIDNIDYAAFPPAKEIADTEQVRAKLKGAVSAQFKSSNDERAIEEMTSEIHSIENGLEINFADKYISLIYPEKVCLLDYFSERRGLVLIRGTVAQKNALNAAEWRMNQAIEELLSGGTIAPKYAEYSKPSSAFDLFCDKNVTLHIDSLAGGVSGKKLGGLFGFRTRHTVSYAENPELLKEDLRNYISDDYRIVLLCENETAAKNLLGILEDEKFSAFLAVEEGDYTSENLPRTSIMIYFKEHLCGYELLAPKIAVISAVSDLRMGGQKATKRSHYGSKSRGKAKKILSYAELEAGDYVVHDTYGIGIYLGIENMTINGVSRDYISIQYAGSDKLFLPIEKLDMVSKYIGAHSDDGTLKLSKFGGGDWGKAKSKAKAAVKEMAKELIQLYATRMRKQGFAFPEDDDYQRDFDAAFEYEETPGQLSAIEEIKRDMTSDVPMDRLLCGDVGFGKTEVAFRAAYKAVLGGKQVAILVPTTILALQHYQTALSRFRSFPVTVDLISRFRTAKQQAQTLRRLKRGEIDIIIGTHRLVSKDIEFSSLGLLIIDEEQRFGVAQKEKLKQIAHNVDVLTLTATPIPRTLNMAMGGIRDISILDDAPGNRLPVQTYVLEYDALIIEDAIRRELRRGGQVFYLYNNVENINVVAARLSSSFPDAKITVAHGKMEREELEDIWNGMLSGDIDILVSTTIIETGIDIPNANTLIVENSHRLGLSQLHQIRGRVGRSARRAYAYFTYPKGRAISEISTKRLEAIRDYAEFGAGFKIALRDMEIRGAGNLLGANQHGHLDAIGYDMYIKLLNEAVLEEKGEKPEEKLDCTVNVSLDAFLPERYVKSSSQRMELYKRIATIETELDYEDIADELLDRFGNLPRPAENLLGIALLRAKAVRCKITKLEQVGSEIHIYPSEFLWDIWSELNRQNKGKIKMVMSSNPYLNYRLGNDTAILKALDKLLSEYLEMRDSAEVEKEETD